ncbi:F-box only protein 28 [Aedes albopictus]|uniref:F-box domain-containing protein n=1 Tax=Aedes albopictus TaxID=7160 RepID=A0ABM1YNZ1_AEDAL|nr:F-box only protein 28-like [Aedes albopictus]
MSSSDGPSSSQGIHFLDLPDCMIEQVFEYLSYDEIAKKRIVCRKIDRVCQSLLNRGFMKMIKRHNANLKAIKSQLPRRESERRNHPLAKHSDILTCIETRISMLSMTYSKYIDKDLCCFIPGKVIDEVFNILKLIESTSKPLRAHEVLQELRDISSMAIEHFDENIAHRLKRIMGVHHPSGSHLPFSTPGFIQNEVVLPCDVNGEKLILPTLTPISPHKASPQQLYCHQSSSSACSASRINNASIARITNKSRKMRLTINKLVAAMQSSKNLMKQMRSQIMRNCAEIKDLRRRLEESETKNRELLANINQLAFGVPSSAELGSGAASEATPKASSRAAMVSRNIKPRSATIILKRVLANTESLGVSSSMVPSPDYDEPMPGSSKRTKYSQD